MTETGGLGDLVTAIDHRLEKISGDVGRQGKELRIDIGRLRDSMTASMADVGRQVHDLDKSFALQRQSGETAAEMWRAVLDSMKELGAFRRRVDDVEMKQKEQDINHGALEKKLNWVFGLTSTTLVIILGAVVTILLKAAGVAP